MQLREHLNECFIQISHAMNESAKDFRISEIDIEVYVYPTATDRIVVCNTDGFDQKHRTKIAFKLREQE